MITVMLSKRLWRKKKGVVGILLLLLCGVAYLYFSLSTTHNAVDQQDGILPVVRRPDPQGKQSQNEVKDEDLFERKDVNYNVFAFYYAWYGNVKFNGKYIHWKHKRLEHWNKLIGQSYSKADHIPPDDIGANYYPQIGLYSFLDSSAIETHFEQMRIAGIGVVVVSWYPPYMADDMGTPTHYIIPRLLYFAARARLKVALHIEPYAQRDPVNLRRHIRMLRNENITNHVAYFRRDSKPVFFIYDSYRTAFNQWSRLLTKTGDLTIRGTPLDAFVLGLYFRDGDCLRFGETGFNGAYSYFGIDGFTPGTRTSEWSSITEDCKKRGVEFVPCVAPGYDDTAVRPWNIDNKRERENGKYYRQMFEAAINSGSSSIAITSFNEWHEGTQIEPAIPKKVPKRTYSDYLPNPPEFYLHLTRALVNKFASSRKGIS